jgi:hypothetical protein
VAYWDSELGLSGCKPIDCGLLGRGGRLAVTMKYQHTSSPDQSRWFLLRYLDLGAEPSISSGCHVVVAASRRIKFGF